MDTEDDGVELDGRKDSMSMSALSFALNKSIKQGPTYTDSVMKMKKKKVKGKKPSKKTIPRQ